MLSQCYYVYVCTVELGEGTQAPVVTETIDLTGSDDEEDADDASKSSWPSLYDVNVDSAPRYNTSSAMLSLADSCDPLPQLYAALSRDSSSPSVITIDTPPPPAHSPYSSPCAARSTLLDGASPRPPPAHSNNSSSVGRGSHDRSWMVCRSGTISTSDSEYVPLSLTLRRCPVVDEVSASLTMSSSSSSASPFDAL